MGFGAPGTVQPCVFATNALRRRGKAGSDGPPSQKEDAASGELNRSWLRSALAPEESLDKGRRTGTQSNDPFAEFHHVQSSLPSLDFGDVGLRSPQSGGELDLGHAGVFPHLRHEGDQPLMLVRMDGPLHASLPSFGTTLSVEPIFGYPSSGYSLGSSDVGLFKRKLSAADLAQEAMVLAHERGVTVLNRVLISTGRSGPEDVALVQSRTADFGGLWLHAVCGLAGRLKGGDVRRIANAAPPVIEATFPTVVGAGAKAADVLGRHWELEGASRFRAVAGDVFLAVYPEFLPQADDVKLAAGIELASAVNYFDFLLGRFKVA